MNHVRSALERLTLPVLFVALLAAAPAQADVVEVHPGDSIQAAIDSAFPDDTILIFGEPGFQYHEVPVFPMLAAGETLTLEGVSNPVINTNVGAPSEVVLMEDGIALRGLTLLNPVRDGLPVLEFSYDVEGALIDNSVILGQTMLNGSGNTIENSLLRGRGTLISILGGDNSILNNVIWSVRPVADLSGTTRQPVILISSTPDVSAAVGGNLLSGNTVIGWKSLRPDRRRRRDPLVDAIGVGVDSLGGAGNSVVDSIVIRSARGLDVVSLSEVVDVSFSLLRAGAPGPNVALGSGVLVGVSPRLVAPRAGDFRLKPGSPAIDAGDPASELDPDGTRRDMGALFFDSRLLQVPLPLPGPDPASDDASS